MQRIGKFAFPERGNKADLDAWQPAVAVFALASCVLAVARTRIEGTWRAYCDAVPGQDHNAEYDVVLLNGYPMQEQHARAIFPQFDGVPYAR